jgi:hypothetical protein
MRGSVGGVSLGQARRHKALDGLSAELVGRPAEQLRDLRARIYDPTESVGGDDDVRARVEDQLGA